MNYTDFIYSKSVRPTSHGLDIPINQLNPLLYDFQRDIVRFALAKGRSAIFADCGLGKTAMQLEWAHQIANHTGGSVLILAPLAVAEQTVREGEKFGIHVHIARNQSDVTAPICITNYEKLDHFTASAFEGVVLDESSILKSFSGKIRTDILDRFSHTPFKLACTATPAPNDYMEIGNHAEFIGSMSRSEMLSMFFVHDGGETSKWRLKGHAESLFWEWMASWSVFITNPKDLGYTAIGYDLPLLNQTEVFADGEKPTTETLTLTQRRDARRDSLSIRCKNAADLVNTSDEQWLVWCDLNAESEMLSSMIDGAVEVTGSDKDEHKAAAMMDFAARKIKCLVTKPSIAGFGMNWQNCHNMIFTGLSDSFEQYYQAVRRCWRFGQTQPVNVHIILSSKEGTVLENIHRKQTDFEKMQRILSSYTKDSTRENLHRTEHISTIYTPTDKMHLPNWREFACIA